MKKWYLSKTVIGAVVAIIASLLDSTGVHLAAGDKDQVVEIILKLMEIGGAAFAIYGRTKAESKLTR